MRKAISPPTGENTAVEAYDPAGASCTRFVPSRSIAQMVVPQSNAILPPSGDQLMPPQTPARYVRRLAFDSSAPMTYNSHTPPSSRPNAIALPLGDHA